MFQPDRAYLIVGNPRSGTTRLTESLMSTGVLGRPQEYFWRMVERRHAEEMGVDIPTDENYATYLDAALRFGTSANGVFGAKLFWAHAQDLVRRTGLIDEFAGLTPLQRVFAPFGPDPKIVFVRRNVLRSALSLWRAEVTDEWGRRPGDVAPPAPSELDIWRVTVLHGDLHSAEQGWNHVLGALGVEPLSVTYEQIAADVTTVVRDIANRVGVHDHSVDDARSLFLRQADDTTERFLSEWREATGGCDLCDSGELQA